MSLNFAGTLGKRGKLLVYHRSFGSQEEFCLARERSMLFQELPLYYCDRARLSSTFWSSMGWYHEEYIKCRGKFFSFEIPFLDFFYALVCHPIILLLVKNEFMSVPPGMHINDANIVFTPQFMCQGMHGVVFPSMRNIDMLVSEDSPFCGYVDYLISLMIGNNYPLPERELYRKFAFKPIPVAHSDNPWVALFGIGYNSE